MRPLQLLSREQELYFLRGSCEAARKPRDHALGHGKLAYIDVKALPPRMKRILVHRSNLMLWIDMPKTAVASSTVGLVAVRAVVTVKEVHVQAFSDVV